MKNKFDFSAAAEAEMHRMIEAGAAASDAFEVSRSIAAHEATRLDWLSPDVAPEAGATPYRYRQGTFLGTSPEAVAARHELVGCL